MCRSQEQQVYAIEPVVQRARTAATVQPKETIYPWTDFNGTFLCPECGYFRTGVAVTLYEDGSFHYDHHCDPARRKRTFIDVRNEMCNACRFQTNDRVCGPCKESHPDRDCKCSVGAEILSARCPKNYWLAIEIKCPECGRKCSDPKGVSRCNACGWQGDEQVEMQRFSPGRVGFLATSYMAVGGTEVWHQTLIPRLRDVAGFVALSPSRAGGDFTKLPCRTGVGLQAARQLAASVDVLVVWGVGERLESVLGDSAPHVISVSHCDSRSEWTVAIMQEQAKWSDQSVYLCGTGKDTCPSGKPAVKIANAPDPARIASGRSKAEMREHYGLGDGDKLLVSVSRLSREKNVDRLVKAMEYLPQDFRLIVAGSATGGDGAYVLELRKMAGERVHFIGDIDAPGELLAAADGFLSASNQEGYGLSIAEAILAGVPVVSTPVGLLEDAPESAAIVPHSSTPEQWAEAIARDFSDPKQQAARCQLAKDSLNTVEQFAAEWQSLIDSC